VARHFLPLYLLIVFTLAAVSWGQDKILQSYGSHDSADDRSLGVAVAAMQNQLQNLPAGEWKRFVADTAAKTGVDMELFTMADITGNETLDKLKRGAIAYMQAARGESWALKQLNDDYVLALKSAEPGSQRQELVLRCRHQTGIANPSSGGDVSQNGGADRRADRFSSRHVQRGIP
jgi:hypothetical protein